MTIALIMITTVAITIITTVTHHESHTGASLNQDIHVSEFSK